MQNPKNIASDHLLGIDLRKKQQRKLKHLMTCLESQVDDSLVVVTQQFNISQTDFVTWLQTSSNNQKYRRFNNKSSRLNCQRVCCIAGI